MLIVIYHTCGLKRFRPSFYEQAFSCELVFLMGHQRAFMSTIAIYEALAT